MAYATNIIQLQLLFVLFILTTLPHVILTWTHFSKTVLLQNGIYSLSNITAACPNNYAIRGFALDKPSTSTFRWALHCVKPINNFVSPRVTHHSTNPDECGDSRIIWLDRHVLQCNPNAVLQSFTFKHKAHSRSCYFEYTCIELNTTLCHSTLSESTVVVDNHLGNILKLRSGEINVIGNYDSSALTGFQFRMNYVNNVLWETYMYYGYCFTSTLDNMITHAKSTGVDVELFFHIDSKEAFNFLESFYDYYRRIEKYISFIPHYVFANRASSSSSTYGNEFVDSNCISGGKYCYEPNNNPSSSSSSSHQVLEGGYYYLLEIIRHLCVFHISHYRMKENNYKMLYWDFIYAYKHQCDPLTAFRLNCASDIFSKYNINSYTMSDCIAESFGSNGAIYNDELTQHDNTFLDRESTYINEKASSLSLSVYDTPFITINSNNNKQLILHQLNAQLVFEEICKALITSLDMYVTPCAKYYNVHNQMKTIMRIIVYVGICICSIFILLIVKGIYNSASSSVKQSTKHTTTTTTYYQLKPKSCRFLL